MSVFNSDIVAIFFVCDYIALYIWVKIAKIKTLQLIFISLEFEGLF